MYPGLQEQKERSEINGLWCMYTVLDSDEEVQGIGWNKR